MLVVDLEKEFGISIPDDDVYKLETATVNELVDYLCKKVEK
jgi:acyl carrier protein